MAQSISFLSQLAVKVVQLYRWIASPLMRPRCRFIPTCSQYAIDALENCGFLKGSWLSIKRILRCHPLNEGGVDLAPRKKGQR